MKKWLPLFIIIGVILLVMLWFTSTYNSFVTLGENVTTSWAQVENQYQRRYDLIPNLVETVKGVAAQEKDVFIGVADARAKVGQFTVTPEILNDPQAFAQFQAAQGELSSALTRLLVTVESYPALKSNENFLALQDQLEGTENRIATERGRFNEAARDYNVKAKAIPGRFVVSMFGLDQEKALFTSTNGAATAPQVQFDTNQ